MTSLSANNYQTSIVLFNDCSSVDLKDSILVNYHCLSQSSLSFSCFAFAINSTGFEVIDLHDTSITTCNGGVALGYKKYEYSNFVVLDSLYDWKIYISVLGRGHTNSCISNINTNFYMESLLYISNGANSNPIANDGADTRMFTLYSFCKNSFIDVDGDSLAYEFINPLLDSLNAVTYNYPYSASSFMPSVTPITLDSVSGNVCMNLGVGFIGITKLQITEWRTINNQKIKVGVSQFDMFVYSYEVHNNAPVLSGMDFDLSKQYSPLDTIYTEDFFAEDTIRFHIYAYDIDSGLNSNCANAHQLEIKLISKDTALSTANIEFVNNNTDSSYVDFVWVP